jgi:hypothetical protein
VPPATALYGDPAGSAVGALSYSLMVSTTVSPLAKVRSLGAMAGQCSLLVKVPTGPLLASVLPTISMLTVFGATAAGLAPPAVVAPPAAGVPGLELLHADAVTATAPAMSPTPISRRCLDPMWVTVITLSD